MPFPNEHAARQADPGQFDKFRRGKPKGFPKGVSAIFGIKGGKSQIQSIRFASSSWTPKRAKEWLKGNGFKAGKFEEAAKKRVDWGDIL